MDPKKNARGWSAEGVRIAVQMGLTEEEANQSQAEFDAALRLKTRSRGSQQSPSASSSTDGTSTK